MLQVAASSVHASSTVLQETIKSLLCLFLQLLYLLLVNLLIFGVKLLLVAPLDKVNHLLFPWLSAVVVIFFFGGFSCMELAVFTRLFERRDPCCYKIACQFSDSLPWT